MNVVQDQLKNMLAELDSERVKISAKGLAGIALGIFVSTVVLLEVDLWAGLLLLSLLVAASFFLTWRHERGLVDRLRTQIQLLQKVM